MVVEILQVSVVGLLFSNIFINDRFLVHDFSISNNHAHDKKTCAE